MIVPDKAVVVTFHTSYPIFLVHVLSKNGTFSFVGCFFFFFFHLANNFVAKLLTRMSVSVKSYSTKSLGL